MSRRAWTIFAVVQVVGVVSIWAGPHWKTDPGLALFGFGIVRLQPGGLAAVMLVEKLLWMGPYAPANELDLAGADRGVQCRVVVVDCEGVEGDPSPPIRPGSILKVFFLGRRLAALSGPDSRPGIVAIQAR